MLRVIVTGGPGVGKTTLLRELSAMGHAVIEESAREIIRERRLTGQTPRPEPREFAAELTRRDREKYEKSGLGSSPVFFDRCLVESVAMAMESGLLSEPEASAMLSAVSFHTQVFVLPPWKEIYTNDAERDHSFEHCGRVHDDLTRWYVACGYTVHEVPRASPRQRAEHVLRELPRSGA
ncbi:MAG: AAA family ATPase [Rubrivivax sp.]|nr:AAA family ATPase [Rubrivivax sp.]